MLGMVLMAGSFVLLYVAIINSSEIFISSYLAVIVFKTEKWPSALLILATATATAGIVFVAVG